MPTLSITNPPDESQAGLVSVEIFAYIGLVVILLADSNKHRTVALFGFLGNLIPGTASVHHRLIATHFVVVDLELLLMGQAAIVLLCKYQCLQDAGCLYTLHSFHRPRLRPVRTDALFREMISEQTACKRQSAANAHCTGCTPMMPLYAYFLADLEANFKRFFEKMSSQYSSAMMPTHLSTMLSPAKETV